MPDPLVEEWYRRRDLRPMIVLPQGAGPAHLEDLLTERGWLPRPGPVFVMTADIAALPASQAEVEFASEPDAAFLGLYRYRGQDLPPIARTLCFPARLRAPFGSRVIRHRIPLNPARLITLPTTRHLSSLWQLTHAPGRDEQQPRPARSTSGVASPTRTVTTA